MKTSFTRSRWAAIGAVVAITLGAGGLHFAGAVWSPISQLSNPVTYTNEPCRLMDTRPNGVGVRTTPLAPNETYVVSAYTGDCGGIQGGAVSIITNVTIVNPTASGFLTVYPGLTPKPLASNLNWIAGQNPTPNSVITGLSRFRTLNIFNGSGGTVDVIVDIVGAIVPADLAATNSCKEFPHEGVVWDGCFMRGADLNNTNVALGTLINSDFERVIFDQVYAVDTNFSGSNLKDGNFVGADLVRANFAEVDLTNVDFTGANLSGSHLLTASSLTGIIWTNAICPDLTNANNHGFTCIGHL